MLSFYNLLIIRFFKIKKKDKQADLGLKTGMCQRF